MTAPVAAPAQPFSLDAALNLAHASQPRWANSSVSTRATLLKNLAHVLRQQKTPLAVLITNEVHKPVGQAVAEIEKCALACDYYAQEGAALLQPRTVTAPDLHARIHHQPYGVILAVMPWNFPFWQVVRVLAPALMAGNSIALKHASLVPQCAAMIASLCTQAGIPEGVVTHLPIRSSEVASVIADPRIAAVTFTGSEEAGRQVAAVAGQHLKKTVLELGGSDPYLILGGADLGEAIEAITLSRLINNGQSCVAAKRCIVVSPLYEWAVSGLKDRFNRIRMGHAGHQDTELGPLVDANAREQLHDQVQRSIAAGAELVIGGRIPEGEGPAYYPATILKNVQPGMPAFDEELFGPVLAVTRAADEDDAIHLANQSRYGLGAAVFGGDVTHLTKLAGKIQCGMVGINRMLQSDPRVPFGGIKNSGFGRELGPEGLLEWMQTYSMLLPVTSS